MAVIQLNIGANLNEFMAGVRNIGTMGKQAGDQFEKGFESNKITPAINTAGMSAVGKQAGGMFSSGFKAMFGGAFFGSMLSSMGITALMGLKTKLKEASLLAADFSQAQKNVATTLLSTKGAAGVTQNELEKYAASMQKVTNFSKTQIMNGQGMLLTFTSIGKEVFPMATEAMLNMSAKMGTDASSTAIQLGKALNDPIRGSAALRRVGVALTTQQLDQIKAFQNSGDMMSAQKIILNELNTEFGNYAKGTAKASTISQNSMNDVLISVGQVFNGIKLAFRPLQITLFSGLQSIMDSILKGGLLDAIKGLFSAIADILSPIIQAIIFAFKTILPIASTVFMPIIKVLGQVAKGIKYILVPTALLIIGFKALALATWIANASSYQLMLRFNSLGVVMKAHALWTTITTAVTNLFTAANWALVASFLANPIVWIVTGIAALVAGIILAYKNSETFRNIIQGLWQGIKNLAEIVWNSLITAWEFLVDIFMTYVLPVLKGIGIAIGILITIALAPLVAAVYLLIKYWDEIWEVMKAVGSWIATTFIQVWKDVWKWISDLATLIWDSVIGALKSFYEFMKPIVVFALKWLNITGLLYQGLYYLYTAILKPFIEEYFPGLSKVIQDVVKWFMDLWKTLLDGAVAVLQWIGLMDDENKKTEEGTKKKKDNREKTKELKDEKAKLNKETKKNTEETEKNTEANKKAIPSLEDLKKKLAQMFIEGKQGTDEFSKLNTKVFEMIGTENKFNIALAYVNAGLKLQSMELQKVKASIDGFDMKSIVSPTKELSETVVTDAGKIQKGLSLIKIPDSVIKSIDDYDKSMANSFEVLIAEGFPALEEYQDKFNSTFQAFGITFEDFTKNAIGAFADTTQALIEGQTNASKAILGMLIDTVSKAILIYAPQILAAFMGQFGAWGLPAGLLAIGVVEGLLQVAKSSAGFKEGSDGLTKGGINDIAGYVHGQELVVEHGLAQKMLPIYKFMKDGGTDYDYFKQRYEKNVMSEYQIAKSKQKEKEMAVSFKHQFGNVKIGHRDIEIAVRNSQYARMRKM